MALSNILNSFFIITLKITNILSKISTHASTRITIITDNALTEMQKKEEQTETNKKVN